jgi:pimeloyl-ACP methyl ester carboxylesterase
MAYLKINGLNTYYETHGEGEVIILLHHGFGCTRMWKEINPGLTREGYKTVMYDRRGYGRSEEGPDFDRFYVSPSFRAEGIKELESLRKVLGLESFHLLGQCEGGVVAVDYATRYPEQVKSITLSSTQCYNDVPMPEWNRKMFPKSLRELDPGLGEKLAEWHGRERAGRFFDMFRDRGGSYGTGIFDLRPILPAVTCPVLVLYPDRSALFDVEQGVAFYRQLPNGELAVLPKCGHNTYENQPVEYVRNVLSFLQRQNAYIPREYLNATCVAVSTGRQK